MKLTPRRMMMGGGLFAAVLLALLAFFLWPEASTGPGGPVAAQAKAKKPVRPPAALASAEIPQFQEPKDVLERLGIDPKVTPHCAILNQWHDRNVPMWVMLKNVDAQAMFFNEKELECLTASPLPPGIVDTAEQRVRVDTTGRRNPGGPGALPGGD